MSSTRENRANRITRVNLSIRQDVWKEFEGLVSRRQKSAIITKLLENEIERLKEAKWREELALSFQKMAKDEEYWKEAAEWDVLDVEEWPE
jgi:metal-responsive CopG/Arc/MetJ family transcriptional regulator